jgi:tRNA pseudouridine(55) synthase
MALRHADGGRAQTYRTTGLLGTATTSYDSQDPILLRAPHTHVTPELLRSSIPRFTGPQQQLPPLYSAIKIDGKRLFEYAREGLQLPRPIPARSVEVKELALVGWHKAGEHQWREPEQECDETEKGLVGRVRQLAGLDPAPTEAPPSGATTDETEPADAPPAAFTLDMTVTSGTYVRSIVHDLGAAVGSAAHVVRLTRSRQGEFSIGELGAAGGAVLPTEDAQPAEKVDEKAPAAAADAASEAPASGAETPVSGAEAAVSAGDAEVPKEEAAAAAVTGTEAPASAPATVPDEVALPGNCIEWSVFAEALADLEADRVVRDENGLAEWERVLLSR